jgi:replicative DNA helicase Mcm
MIEQKLPVCYVDEGDKMKSTDRDALHEAMEQQEINISKAGIIATLKTRTAVFMSANPKYGQFTKNEALADQINLPPSLLSRFDLIFLLLDEPDPTNDAKISTHILQTHAAGEMRQQREVCALNISSEEAEFAEKHIKPEIEPDLFKKHVAYARKHIFPVLTKESMDHIHEYYLSLRKVAVKTKSIPITFRQEEAMVRLAEASARIRLSQKVTLEDAKRATNLMDSCLENIGVDPDTGEKDGSLLNSGYSKDQRTAIKEIKEIIRNRMSKHVKGNVPIIEVFNEAELKGISKERVEKSIVRMANQGDVFKSDKEHVKLTA